MATKANFPAIPHGSGLDVKQDDALPPEMARVLAKIIARFAGLLSLIVIGVRAAASIDLAILPLSDEALHLSGVIIAIWVMCEMSWRHK